MTSEGAAPPDQVRLLSLWQLAVLLKRSRRASRPGLRVRRHFVVGIARRTSALRAPANEEEHRAWTHRDAG